MLTAGFLWVEGEFKVEVLMAPSQGKCSSEECDNELAFLPVELCSACAHMGESWKSIYLKNF